MITSPFESGSFGFVRGRVRKAAHSCHVGIVRARRAGNGAAFRHFSSTDRAVFTLTNLLFDSPFETTMTATMLHTGILTEIAGQPIPELARQFGTPAYIYDAATIRDKAAQLGDFDVVRYAQKACSNIAILDLIRRCGVLVDAVSARARFTAPSPPATSRRRWRGESRPRSPHRPQRRMRSNTQCWSTPFGRIARHQNSQLAALSRIVARRA